MRGHAILLRGYALLLRGHTLISLIYFIPGHSWPLWATVARPASTDGKQKAGAEAGTGTNLHEYSNAPAVSIPEMAVL